MFDKKKDEKLREVIKESLTAQHRSGMVQGAKAICAAVLDIAQDTAMTPDTRIEKIVAFCSVSLGANDKKAENGGDDK